MNKILRTWLYDLGNCLYPKICPVCKTPIRTWNRFLCYPCHEKLAYTHSWKMNQHPMHALFWGRIPIERIDSLFHYRKNSPIQTVLHRIKYHHYPELAEELGRYYGKYLAKSGKYQRIDWLVPIPMHPKKELERGYNQAHCFAKGLSETMNIPVHQKILQKTSYTFTQTQKNRTERNRELAQSFSINPRFRRSNQHFVLVDDVLTTGATLDAAASQLLKIKGAKVSIVTLAVVI